MSNETDRESETSSCQSSEQWMDVTGANGTYSVPRQECKLKCIQLTTVTRYHCTVMV